MSFTWKVSSNTFTMNTPDAEIKSFDYIIVGGGTSGCFIAKYLLSKGFTVGLFEKGSSPINTLCDVNPRYGSGTYFFIMSHLFGSMMIEKKATKQNSHSNNRNIDYMVGNVLGGSSSVNWSIIATGYPIDFQNLNRSTNSCFWNFEDSQKHFQKLFFNDSDRVICDNFPNGSTFNILNLLIQSMDKNGFNFVENYIGNPNECCSFTNCLRHKNDNLRSSSFNDYLRNDISHSNLNIFL